MTTVNIAEFYAGITQATFELDVREDLNSCMNQTDAELGTLWQKALDNLAAGNEDQWERYFSMAQSVSAIELMPCGESSDLLQLGSQLEMWWGSFWSNPEAHKEVEASYSANKAEIDGLVSGTVTKWDEGDFFGAGESFGQFWSILIGKPTWQESPFPENPTTEDNVDTENIESASKHPLADYYASSLNELFNEDWTEEIN